MISKSRILITGAQGFLGRKVVEALGTSGIDILPLGRRKEPGSLTCDLSDPSSVEQVIGREHFDMIIHCAAHVPHSSKEEDEAACAEQSVAMVENLLRFTSCPLVYVSSMTVYGTGGASPKKEDDAGDPKTAYGAGKWRAEKLIEKSGRPAWCVRLPGLFGEPRKGGIVRNVVRSLRDSLPLALPERSVVWAGMSVTDAAQGVAALARIKPTGYQPINFAYRGAYSISRLVEMASELFGKTYSYSIEQPDFEFDLALAEGLGITPEHTLRNALNDLREIP